MNLPRADFPKVDEALGPGSAGVVLEEVEVKWLGYVPVVRQTVYCKPYGQALQTLVALGATVFLHQRYNYLKGKNNNDF